MIEKKKLPKRTATRIHLALDDETIRMIDATSMLGRVRKNALVKRAMFSYLRELPAKERANIMRLVRQIPPGIKDRE